MLQTGGLPFLAIERQIAHREILIAAWGNEVFQSLRSEMWQMQGKVTILAKFLQLIALQDIEGAVWLR